MFGSRNVSHLQWDSRKEIFYLFQSVAQIHAPANTPRVLMWVCVCVYGGDGSDRNLGVCSCHNEMTTFIKRRLVRVWTLSSPDIHFPHQFKILSRNAVLMNQDCHCLVYNAHCSTTQIDLIDCLPLSRGWGHYVWVTSAALSVSLLRSGFLQTPQPEVDI